MQSFFLDSLNVRTSFATGQMPFKGLTFRNPNVTENYENLDSAGPYIAEELPITSSVLFPVDSGASAQTSTADAGRSVHSVLSKSQSSSTSSTSIAELEQDFASKARRNDDTMLNSIPDLKNFLENGVDNGILTYEKSLVLERVRPKRGKFGLIFI